MEFAEFFGITWFTGILFTVQVEQLFDIRYIEIFQNDRDFSETKYNPTFMFIQYFGMKNHRKHWQDYIFIFRETNHIFFCSLIWIHAALSLEALRNFHGAKFIRCEIYRLLTLLYEPFWKEMTNEQYFQLFKHLLVAKYNHQKISKIFLMVT